MPTLSTSAENCLPSFENCPSMKTDIGPPVESTQVPAYAPFVASQPVRPLPWNGMPMNEPLYSVTSHQPPHSIRQVSVPFDVWPIAVISASHVPTQASRRFTSGGSGGAPASCC